MSKYLNMWNEPSKKSLCWSTSDEIFPIGLLTYIHSYVQIIFTNKHSFNSYTYDLMCYFIVHEIHNKIP